MKSGPSLIKTHLQLLRPRFSVKDRLRRRESQIEKMKRDYVVFMNCFFHPVPRSGRGFFMPKNRVFGGVLSRTIPEDYDFDPWGKEKMRESNRRRIEGCA